MADRLCNYRGGQVTAIKLRAQALEQYYRNPNKCLFCHQIVRVDDKDKVSEVRRRKFCNHRCFGSYTSLQWSKKPKATKLTRPRAPKYFAITNGMTKGELFTKCKNWQSARTMIRAHATDTFMASGKPKVCALCGYALHIEVAHIKPVSDFSNDTPIRIINGIANLIALCPNQHWEFDAGLLSITENSGMISKPHSQSGT